jgi:hypothetical protein
VLLIEFSLYSDAWVIDGGMHCGVMQLVGEAFKNEETYALETNQSRTVVLGVTNWTTIRNKEFLISTNVK